MKSRVAGLGFGLLFGFWLCWTRFTSFDVIRAALLFQDLYMWLMFGSALVVGAAGIHALRRAGARTLLEGSPVGWTTQRPNRDHVVGSVLFGVGWAIAGTCPGPVAAQVGHGQLAGLFTMAGMFGGIALRGWVMRRQAGRGVPLPVGACAQP